MSLDTLRTKVKLQEQQKVATVVKPSGLGEQIVGLVSSLLDFLLRTDGEISQVNQSDAELIRCVNEELGVLSTLLSNKVQIASHLALNTGRAFLKKRRLRVKEDEQKTTDEQTEAVSTQPRQG